MTQPYSSDAKHLLREKYNGIETPEFFADLERLNNEEPLAYIIGNAPFLGTTIYLDSHPLIPRVESEYWLAQALHEHTDPSPLSVLDIFAGSGALGIAWGHHRPTDAITFAEIETTHLTTIQKNIETNNIPNTSIIQSDVWENISDSFDIILANPPYVPHTRTLPQSVSAYEPHEALFAGADGTDLITKFMRDLELHLNPGGTLYLEHDHTQTPCTLLSSAFTCEQRTDQYGVNRYIMAKLTNHGA